MKDFENSKLNIFKEENYNLKITISIFVLVMVLSAIFGFIYEEIFYYFDLGHLVKRGSTYGPWIPIYAFGGLFITLFTYRFRKNPYVVFVLNCLITGVLEYGTGFVLYEVFGMRLWDYNTEILNFGNINGYICLRSILFFGVSSLLLIYMVIPIIKKILTKIPIKTFSIVSYTLGCLFLLDMIVYNIFTYFI